LDWVAGHCHAVIHNAASLTFEPADRQSEPWLSNLEGTRQVLAVCRRAGIRQLHHVSTAYVAGLREGRILESELDEGQELGNDYERSKLEGEKLVRAAGRQSSWATRRPATRAPSTASTPR
jgi:nucleoside-diphosphate-sugar epimerase